MAFWRRVAVRLIDVLSSYTRDGSVFAVDTRLRPGGHEGELVVTEDRLLNYAKNDAKVWEALTFTKLAPVAGNLELGRAIISHLVETLYDRFSPFPGLEDEIHQMRRRLEREKVVPDSNLKTIPGGYYDVDFAVAYLRLKNRLVVPPGSNMMERLDALEKHSLIDGADAKTLREGAALLRSIDHAIRLVTGKAAEGLPEHVSHTEAVDHLARRWGLVQGDQNLRQHLREKQHEIRYVYRRLVGSE